MQATSIEDIVKNIFKIKKGTAIKIFSPVIRGQKGGTTKIQKYMQMGFVKARINKELKTLSDRLVFSKNKSYHVELLMDHLYVETKYTSRIEKSIQLASQLSNGFIEIEHEKQTTLYCVEASCPVCFFSPPELEPKFFSFNSPKGACQKCNGMGVIETEQREITCSKCQGLRLRKEALSVEIAGKNISELCQMDLEELETFLKKLKFSSKQTLIAKKIIRQLTDSLEILKK